MSRLAKKLLLIGWDAADWKVINPLLDAGLMPNLGRLVEGGTIGNLATLDPPISPTLWTSMSTGKRPFDHGIVGFNEPDPSGDGIRPIHITSRKGKAVWNILTQEGLRTHQVGWWPSHPAEPINGISISDFFKRSVGPITAPWPLAPGTVHPADRTAFFASLRIHSHELTHAHILPFIPDAAQLDQTDEGVQKRLDALRRIIAEVASLHAAATYILEYEPWDFLALYLDGIDHFCHGFMKFHPPQRDHIPDDLFVMYSGVVAAGYRYHDLMLGRLLELAGDEATVMLVSDHGFHPDHLRPTAIPDEPAGPVIEHRPYGVIAMKGAGLKQDARLYGASLLDITPTILHLFGLPVGGDMEGRVLADAFEADPEVAVIPSWDAVPGEAGLHTETLRTDPAAARAALEQLVALGYIDAPGDDAEKAVQLTREENDFYCARAYLHAGRIEEAIALLKPLVAAHPEAVRYGQYLADAYLRVGRGGEAGTVVERLGQVLEKETAGLLVLRGLVALHTNEPRQALEALLRARVIAPNAPAIHLNTAHAFQALAEWDEAAAAFRRVLDLDPEHAAAWHGLGVVGLRTERPEEAADHLLTAIGLQYHLPFAHYHLGEALTALGEFEEAARAYAVCLHMRPGLNRARARLAELYEEHLGQPEQAAAYRAALQAHTEDEIVIVSGLPRSGTSMMMKMLEAGGLVPFVDEVRAPDASNPGGYYEHQAVKGLMRNQHILGEIGDRVLKVVAPLLGHLPDRYRYRVVFMERDLNEVLASQHQMLVRQGKATEGVMAYTLLIGYQQILDQVREVFARRANVSLTTVAYTDVLDAPEATAHRVAQFLGRPLDVTRMAAVVDPALYRARFQVPRLDPS